jgi:hypothetical protein
MVTHNPRIAEQARRVIQLEDGRITSDVWKTPSGPVRAPGGPESASGHPGD